MMMHPIRALTRNTQQRLLLAASGLVAFLLVVPFGGPVERLTRIIGSNTRLHAADAIQRRASPERPLLGPAPTVALRQIEHLQRLGVTPWHAAGYLGQRLKIAVIDSGFRGYRAHLGKELPSHITVHSFRSDGNLEARNSQHGILCGEVLHTLAPEAELLFANWETDSPEQFLAAARWAREQGARIISCSVIMPSWSDGEGGGAFHEALARIVGNGQEDGDVLFFASAGNTARRHWSGAFCDAGDRFHQWSGEKGKTTGERGQRDNEVIPWGSDRVSVELCWPPGPRYKLIVWDATVGSPVGPQATRSATGRTCAVVRFVPQPRHSYQARVQLLEGSPGPFHLVALGGDLMYTTAHGSVACPADGPEVLAVGAAGFDGRRAWYSSCGPNSKHQKPDLVAPVPFPSQWRPEPFAGTSAAAPQAAGLAALWWSRHPDWSADQVSLAVKSSAVDLGPPGPDDETGYGLVHLPSPQATSDLRQPIQAQLPKRATATSPVSR